MAKIQVVHAKAGEELNAIAIGAVQKKLKTLIITGSHKYVPPIDVLRGFKHDGNAFITETTSYCDALTASISNYKSFILVGFEPNHFEVEFFNQICAKLDKEIVCIKGPRIE